MKLSSYHTISSYQHQLRYIPYNPTPTKGYAVLYLYHVDSSYPRQPISNQTQHQPRYISYSSNTNHSTYLCYLHLDPPRTRTIDSSPLPPHNFHFSPREPSPNFFLKVVSQRRDDVGLMPCGRPDPSLPPLNKLVMCRSWTNRFIEPALPDER